MCFFFFPNKKHSNNTITTTSWKTRVKMTPFTCVFQLRCWPGRYTLACFVLCFVQLYVCVCVRGEGRVFYFGFPKTKSTASSSSATYARNSCSLLITELQLRAVYSDARVIQFHTFFFFELHLTSLYISMYLFIFISVYAYLLVRQQEFFFFFLLLKAERKKKKKQTDKQASKAKRENC